MCAPSRVGSREKTWCGTGWTGQPALWRREDGVLEVIFGAFDRRVHFVDLTTGRASRPSFPTGDIIKGSVTLDPDGEPLLYFGSRDDRLRILALDQVRPRQLWSLDANSVGGLWNNDWDGNPLVLGDVLFEGGENGYLFAVKLNRDYDDFGQVNVRPEILLAYPAWTGSLLRRVGDRNASIEGSVAAFADRIYFANSAGRVVGLEVSRVQRGQVRVVFDFWMGDDVDASIAVDEQGMLYVAAEQERFLPRAEVVGQLVKLNPYRPADPLLWSVKVPPGLEDWRGGIWASPALGRHSLFVVTQSGLLLEVERSSGRILASDRVGVHAWSSPVLAEPWLLVATCRGEIRCYRVDRPGKLELDWRVEIPSRACIESTPLVWNGHIVVGARDGYVYAFGPPPRAVAATSPRPLTR